MSSEVQALKAHLALNVHNVERSIEFYQKMLGIEPSKVRTVTQSSTCRIRR